MNSRSRRKRVRFQPYSYLHRLDRQGESLCPPNAAHHARASSHVACMGLLDVPTFKTYFAKSPIRSKVSGRVH